MLKDQVKPGDIILTRPKTDGIGKLITKFTMSDVSHAAIVYDSQKLFETDGDMFKAGFNPIEEYETYECYIIRSKSMQEPVHQDFLRLSCEKYLGKPYSYWDIATNGLFFWIARPFRQKLVKLLGTEYCMICSELVSRIVYEVLGREEWREFEGMTPADIKDIAFAHPEEYIVYKYQPALQ